MDGLDMLDVAIGMTFIFLLLSLICTALNEIIETYLKKRAVDLERGIRTLLQDSDGKGLASKLYNHPLISGLFKGEYDPNKIKKNGEYKSRCTLPSYIPSQNFAIALMDAVGLASVDNKVSPQALKSLKDTIGGIEKESVKKALLALANNTGDNIDKFRTNIEAWYDSSMDRVAGWYKRRAQIITFCLGLFLAVALNADSIAIFKSLTNNPALRSSLIAASQELIDSQNEENGEAASKEIIKKNIEQLEQLRLPIGWDWKVPEVDDQTIVTNSELAVPSKENYLGWVSKVFGWVLMAIAISLGAPFWFDVLNKFMMVRATVKPKEKSPKEESED
ncbi:MAG: hypothetical protein AAF632_02570 [Bacteroidota bacterium]